MRLLWWCQAAGLLALTHQALSRPDEARQTLDDAREFILHRHSVRVLPNLDAFQAEVHRLQGRLDEAGAWAAQVDPGPLNWALAVVDPRIAQARAYLWQGTSAGQERAALLIAELHEFCRRVPNTRLLMEAEAIDALLRDERGEGEAALQALERVVIGAEADGWIRLFVDLGPRMAILLTRLAARGVSPRYLERVLAAFPTQHIRPAPQPTGGLIEPLTEREREVLDALAQRYSNKEIAARLFIAPSTVKRHTLHIYRKLDVNDRREAVVRATQLGLLPVA
jgi:LuxR family maltose regulon positive regulatory protein